MKTRFLIVALIAFSNMSFSQDTTSTDGYEYFIVLYTVGENWDTTIQVNEQLYFDEHSLHLAELRKAKKISIGGRYSDTGMLLLKAKDETDAQNLITKDSAIEHKLFKVELFSFDPFYNGCIE